MPCDSSWYEGCSREPRHIIPLLCCVQHGLHSLTDAGLRRFGFYEPYWLVDIGRQPPCFAVLSQWYQQPLLCSIPLDRSASR